MSDSRIKILLITVRADYGGGPEHIYSLIKELHKEIDFYVACPDDFPYKERYSGILGENKITLIPHRKFRLTYLFKLKSYVKDNRINIIHSNGKGGGIYSRLLSLISSTPCIHTFDGVHTGNYNNYQKFLYILLERFLSLFTKKIISVSDGEYKEIIENKIANPSKISIVKNGVGIPNSPISEEIFYSSPKNIITFTRYNHQKNTSQLIFIFEELKKQNKADLFKMIVLGNGEEEDKIKKMSEDRNLNNLFDFKGLVENRYDYLINSFCYVSTSRWEGMPFSLLEAMSFGIPVIATDVIGNNNILEHNKTGFLYNMNNPREAADLIIKLASDFDLWKSFSTKSRKEIKLHFSSNKMAVETQKVYNTI